jgi:hypothetical protein
MSRVGNGYLAGGGGGVVAFAGAATGAVLAGASVDLLGLTRAVATGRLVRASRRARIRLNIPASANWVINMTATLAIRKYFFIFILLQRFLGKKSRGRCIFFRDQSRDGRTRPGANYTDCTGSLPVVYHLESLIPQ